MHQILWIQAAVDEPNTEANNCHLHIRGMDPQNDISCAPYTCSYVAIRNPERHVRKASHRGSKQQQRSCPTRSLYYCLFAAHICMGVILRAHPVRGESHIERNTKRLNLGCGAGAQIKTEKEPKLSLEFRTGTGDMAI